MSAQAPDDNLSSLASALRSLQPEPARIDRDRLLYAAGRQSAARHPWLWPAACAACLLLACFSTERLISERSRQQVREVHYRGLDSLSPSEANASGPQTPWGWTNNEELDLSESNRSARLREQVLTMGADTLPIPAFGPTSESAVGVGAWQPSRSVGRAAWMRLITP